MKVLGQILVAQGAVRPQQLEAALAEQERRSAQGRAIRLGELLMEMRLITKPQLSRALAAREQAQVR